MPIDDTAVALPSSAHILFGTVGVTAPTWSALNTYINGGFTGTLTGWTDVGHTTLDEIVAFGSDGGDSEVKGSLQNKSLRETITKVAVDFITVTSLQVKDAVPLALYYGGGTSGTNTFDAPDTALVQERAMLVAIADAAGNLGLLVPRASIRSDDTISMPGDDFTSIPIRATFLKATGQPRVRWMSANFTA